jgi:hypothetical protein
MAKSLILKVNSELYKEIEKRAKREFLDVETLIEDIIRRSMLSYNRRKGPPNQKFDDKLIGIFSRSKSGRKKKKKKK